MTSLQRPFAIGCAVRATFLLVFAWTLTAVFSVTGVIAQSLSQAKDFHWKGPLEQGKTLEVRGVYGSIHTIPSANGSVQVEARIHNPALVRVDVLQRENGITICSVVLTASGDESECQPGLRTADAKKGEDGVDFLIRVPAGVRFSASMIHGDITVNSLQSDVNAATIDGNIELNESHGHSAEFYGNTVSGAIESDFPIYDNAPPPPAGHTVDTHHPRIVRASIGKGGPVLDASTVSGTIRVRTMAEQ